jgi:hypothetical protein
MRFAIRDCRGAEYAGEGLGPDERASFDAVHRTLKLVQICEREVPSLKAAVKSMVVKGAKFVKKSVAKINKGTEAGLADRQLRCMRGQISWKPTFPCVTVFMVAYFGCVSCRVVSCRVVTADCRDAMVSHLLPMHELLYPCVPRSCQAWCDWPGPLHGTRAVR